MSIPHIFSSHQSHYEVIGPIGQGSYGSVFKAIDKQSQQTVAIKVIIIDTTSRETERRDLILVARELFILCQLSLMKQNNATIRLIDVFVNQEAYKSGKELKEVCLVTSYMPTDLASVLSQDIELERNQALVLTYNLLLCLKFIHSAGLVHRDLKPGNILVNQES